MPGEPFDPVEITERFFTVIKSLNEFDKAEVRGVIQTLIAPTERDICFTGNYYRAVANVESILTLKNVRDFQAVAMLARALFELAVDIKLINAVNDSVRKVLTFTDVEKLRSAKRIVAFKTANRSAQVDATIYQQYIASNGARIDAERQLLWPGLRKYRPKALGQYESGPARRNPESAVRGTPRRQLSAIELVRPFRHDGHNKSAKGVVQSIGQRGLHRRLAVLHNSADRGRRRVQDFPSQREDQEQDDAGQDAALSLTAPTKNWPLRGLCSDRP